MLEKFLFFLKKNFVKIFYFFLFFFTEALPIRVENLSVGWRAEKHDFWSKFAFLGVKIAPQKGGFSCKIAIFRSSEVN